MAELGSSSVSVEGNDSPLFLGIDMSTQQLKAVVVDSSLAVVGHVAVQFDDLDKHNTVKGVYTNPDTKEVTAPVAAWLDALDLALGKMLNAIGQSAMSRIAAISGACQQHATVYWNDSAPSMLAQLDSLSHLADLQAALSIPLSHNWQDASTGAQCRLFEQVVGGSDSLAAITGSRAHRRFSGPQILKLLQVDEPTYNKTSRIALASNFMASVMCGSLVPLEKSDVCGMNLWDIQNQRFDPGILQLFGDTGDLLRKLGPVQEISSNTAVGLVSPYYCSRYSLNPSCAVYAFTGDNPATILALPLAKNDVIVSLGTSTTALVVSENFVPSPEYHLFAHPLEASAPRYMGMLCYCNGALAREKVRDKLNLDPDKTSWDNFNHALVSNAYEESCVGFYFPLSEIVPECDPVIQRYSGTPPKTTEWSAEKDALRIVESQMLSIRHRLAPLLTTDSHCARRVFFVGGGSRNETMCSVMASVLAPQEAYRLNLSDACAAGAAHMAVYCHYVASNHSSSPMSWSDFIQSRWSNDRQVPVTFDKSYPQTAVDAFVRAEFSLLN